jgi:YD repeat-containing protein
VPLYAPDGNSALDQLASAFDGVHARTIKPLRDFEDVSDSVGACCRVKADSGWLQVQVRPPAASPIDPHPLLTYNQQFRLVASEFGNGWSEAYRRKVQQAGSTGANVISGTGDTNAYTNKDPVTGYYAPPSAGLNSLKGDSGGWTEKQTDGTAFRYDTSGKLVYLQNPAGARWTLAYNISATRLLSIRDPFSRRTTYAYDASNNLRRIQDSGGRITSFTVNASGDLSRVIDPLANRTTLAYDSVHNLKSWTNPKGDRTTLIANIVGSTYPNLYVTSPKGERTTFTYNMASALYARIVPLPEFPVTLAA